MSFDLILAELFEGGVGGEVGGELLFVVWGGSQAGALLQEELGEGAVVGGAGVVEEVVALEVD